MVSKEELRYGNKVIANGLYEGRIMTFQRLHDLEETIFFTEGHAGEYLKDCDGIPLTPEILERAGAKNEGREHILRVGALKMKLRHYTEWYCELGEIYLGGNIQYLHQLQNLYFALTNKELPITL